MPSIDKTGREAAPHGLDPDLLALLVCPETKAPLDYDRKKNELVSRQAGLAFPIVDGVPVLLVDQARRLGANE